MTPLVWLGAALLALVSVAAVAWASSRSETW